jgi:long-chain acyl-CoA synthetase
MPSPSELREQLTGPGGPFEVVTERVGDHDLLVYRDRLPHLGAVASFARAHGDREFLVHGGTRLTFADFAALADSVSAGLAATGSGHGDRVAVLSQNNPEWCLAFWGTVSMGAVLVGLNGWWNTDEVLYGLADSGARVLVADRRRFERIAGHLDEVPGLEQVYLVDADPSELADADGRVDPRLRRFDELTATPAGVAPDVAIGEDDPAVIFYTSGTTGRPKGAVSTHRNMVANLQNTVFLLTLASMSAPGAAAPGGGGQAVSLLTSPLFHVSGCHSGLVVGMLGGVKLVMPEGRFTPEGALELIERERVTIWATVPTMIWRTCEHPDRHRWDTSSVTQVSFGGSPSAEELQRRVRETFPNIRATTNAYGLTETSSVATTLTGADALRKPDSVGLPVPTVEVAIAAPDGTHLPPGRTGEVLIRGPIVMPGYWGRPEATAEVLRDGWLHTGDVGHLDDEGYLFITDRAKDMVIRGGENVYCVEIEQRLVEHPAIADAAVVGVPHPELGEEVKAVIEVAPGAGIADDEVRAWVAEALAAFKVPAHVQRWDGKLPRNASGKLLKNVLRGDGHVSFAETM